VTGFKIPPRLEGTNSSLCYRSPGVTRRVALSREYWLTFYASAMPHNGVRTFLPVRFASDPAITQLTRQPNYTVFRLELS